ncbi:hypothetical protein AVEN_262090-1 [Araneus ventricosus]|uniref:Uncharacterized protein n=1 Tax=Araneus ventricosus TaxID=182803 RepID=A0A4Y2TCC2_ARAVE|nr:hypothetical protein AVEN_262090-1 [Araneus ventricosus]
MKFSSEVPEKCRGRELGREKYLSTEQEKINLKNGKRYFNLCFKFQKDGFVVKQAEEDAEYLITKSALEIGKGSQSVVDVGEDIDHMVIITASTNYENIFFSKTGRSKTEDALYCAASLNIAPHIRDIILFHD